MQASVKEGRGSVPLCASHRRGAIAPLRIAAPAKCLDCCKRSSAFPVWLVCPSITGCKQLACRSAFEGRLQSACVPAADRLPIARPLLLDCFWSVMSQFHGSSVCAWYSVVFCSLAFLQVRDWCDDLCQYAHVAAAICDTLLLPPIFALCTAPGFQCRFSRRTRAPRRGRLTSCWTRSCYLVRLPLTVLLALRPGVFDGNMTLPLGQHQAAPLRIARPAKCLDCRKRGLSFSCVAGVPVHNRLQAACVLLRVVGRLQGACLPAADRLPLA